MLIVTTETINGKNLEMLGTVKGSTIQTVNAFKDIGAGLKTLVGGELGNYNKMMEKARELATERMVEELKYSCTCKTLDLTLRLDDRVAVYGHFIPGVTKNKDGKKAFALVVYSAHITKMDSV